MPTNPDKRKCTRDGCNAWATRGTTVCASHGRLTRGAGAPVDNTNRLSHGLYSRHFTDEEISTLLNPPSDLADEIALCRVLTGRLMSALTAPHDRQGLLELASMALRSAAVTAKLLRANQVLSGDTADDLAGAIGNVLDQLSTQWDVKL